MTTKAKENQLVRGTMFAFMVSGACSLALGSLIPFLRNTYNLSYDFTGMLVSLQSAGNLVAIGLMGFLPTFIGRRKSVIVTALWMAVSYLLFTTGWQLAFYGSKYAHNGHISQYELRVFRH